MLRALVCLPLASLWSLWLFLPFPRNSDMAGTLLAGTEMARGNWRLAGWWLPSDSYITADIPLHAVLTLLGDHSPIAMLHAGAIIWGGVVTLALTLAPTRGGWLAVLALLAVPVTFAGGPVHMLSESPMHVSTAAFALVCTLVLSRCLLARRKAPYVIAYAVILTLAMIGDALAFIVAVLPALAASVLHLRAPGARRLHLGIILVTIVATLAAPLLVAWNAHTGGYQPPPLPAGFAAWDQMGYHFGSALRWLAEFIGASEPGFAWPSLAHPGSAVLLLRVPLALLLAFSTFRVTVHSARCMLGHIKTLPEYSDVFLCTAVLANVAAAVVSGLIVDEASARYLVPAFVCGAVLTARTGSRVHWRVAYLAVVLMASGAAALRTVTASPLRAAIATPQHVALEAALSRAGLQDGFAAYYTSSLTTALSANSIRTRALWTGPDGKLHPYPWFADSRWYRAPPAGKPVFFVTQGSPGGDALDPGAVTSLMGAPSRQLRVGGYLVDIYPAERVSPDLFLH